MDIIQLLPDNVANQIAAGEVIQRPASAVKELLENAIDAQATHIQLILKDAGKTLIQVIDNGIGMSVTDARLAFERHATSKIKKAEDLFTLQTKGFRGEALASIAAISQVELITKQTDNQIGTQVIIEGNKVLSQEPIVANNGTSIAMKNLFFNIPARRNFLKSDNVELRHILDEFHRVALAHPSIHFTMYHNGNEVFNLTSTSFRKRIVQIFGSKMDPRLLPLKENLDLLQMEGFICKPASKKNNVAQFFIVNERFIKSRYLHHAITSAYEGLLKEGEQPEYFLTIKIDPKSIDINIHPTKTEIKFEDEHTIYALLKSAVKHSLGQFNVIPSIDFSLSQEYTTPYSYREKEVKAPTFSIDPNFNPFKMDSLNSPKKPEKKSFSFAPKKNTDNWESIYTGIPSKVNNFEIVEAVSPKTLFESHIFENAPQTILYFQKKYLITFINDKVLLIHIARAHQRILFEQFMKYISAEKSVSQQLLFPIEMEFSPSEILALETLSEVLFSIGFLFSIEKQKVIFTGIPINFTENNIQQIISDLVANELNETPQPSDFQKEWTAKNMAKNMAYKTGQPLTKEAQQQLVQELFSCKDPQLSPFNKKIYTELLVTDIDNKLN